MNRSKSQYVNSKKKVNVLINTSGTLILLKFELYIELLMILILGSLFAKRTLFTKNSEPSSQQKVHAKTLHMRVRVYKTLIHKIDDISKAGPEYHLTNNDS